jgi:hypothetical protein
MKKCRRASPPACCSHQSAELKNFGHHGDDGTVQVFPEAFVPLQEDAVFLFNDVPALGLEPTTC